MVKHDRAEPTDTSIESVERWASADIRVAYGDLPPVAGFLQKMVLPLTACDAGMVPYVNECATTCRIKPYCRHVVVAVGLRPPRR